MRVKYFYTDIIIAPLCNKINRYFKNKIKKWEAEAPHFILIEISQPC